MSEFAAFEAVKVFSATKRNERDALGETVTKWLQANMGKVDVVDRVVTQSSDSEYHCLAITLFYNFK